MARIHLPALALGAALFTGCASLDDPLKAPQQVQPASYAGTTADTANAGTTDWRTYFNDPLLVQLIDTALARNLDLQMALQRVEMARAGARAARGAQLPTVGLNTTAAMRRFGLYTMDGAGNIVTEIVPGKLIPIDLPDLYIALQATWEVDIWGRLRNQRKAAVSRMLASQEGAHLVMTNVVADVAVAYYELVALDNELAILRETVVRQEEALNVIERQKDAGRANELAVQQFEAQLLGTKALQKEIEQRIVATENLINLLLGRFPQPVQRNAAGLAGPLPADPAVGLPAQLLRNRPDIRAAELELMAARFDLKAARAGFLPNLNITAGYGYQAFDPTLLFESPSSIAYHLVGGLFTPLLNRNALKARFREASAQQLAAVFAYQQRIITGHVEVMNELSNLGKLREAGDLRRQRNDVLQASVDVSRELYRNAKAGYIEVLLAQQNALSANLELVEVQKRQRFALVDLYKALGGGWSDQRR
ncbi:MAG: TolC family protein [Flavobacteriales bacterium]|nr:TolC family protein [Flavobacteriales bacterium]